MKVDFNIDQYKFVIGASWNVVYSLHDDSFFCIMSDPKGVTRSVWKQRISRRGRRSS